MSFNVDIMMSIHVIDFYVNPFLSAHIPYAQSEGILQKYGLLQ